MYAPKRIKLHNFKKVSWGSMSSNPPNMRVAIAARRFTACNSPRPPKSSPPQLGIVHTSMNNDQCWIM